MIDRALRSEGSKVGLPWIRTKLQRKVSRERQVLAGKVAITGRFFCLVDKQVFRSSYSILVGGF